MPPLPFIIPLYDDYRNALQTINGLTGAPTTGSSFMSIQEFQTKFFIFTGILGFLVFFFLIRKTRG